MNNQVVPWFAWAGLVLLSLLLAGVDGKVAIPRRRFAELDHPFDLGPLSCCTAVPINSTLCPELTHSIPCTVATEQLTREKRIEHALGSINMISGNTANCSEAYRKVLCKQNFPACMDPADGSDAVVELSTSECEAELSACPNLLEQGLITEGVCSISNGNYSLGNCSASGPGEEETVKFSYCTVDWYLPSWILEYVGRVNAELQSVQDVFIDMGVSQTCWNKYRDFRCNSVGRCWAQGDRLEQINSLEACNSLLTCLPDDLQQRLQSFLACDMLPSEQVRPATTGTPITERTTETPSTTTTAQPMSSSGPFVTSDPQSGGGSGTISGVSHVFAILTLSALLLT